MSVPPPSSLERLLAEADGDARECAWSDFLAAYSDLLRHVTRRLGGDHDAAMDRYAFVLEAFRRDDFRRLRAYRTSGRGKFSTWLVAVTRRLCVDEHRRRYGRQQSATGETWRATRRELVELIGAELVVEHVEAPDPLADELLEHSEALNALKAALAKLKPGERLLLRLRFEDGLSVPQIARIIGRESPFPVYRDLERLLGALREELHHSGVEWQPR